MRIILSLMAALLFFFSCPSAQNARADNKNLLGIHKFVVLEVLQAAAYTYLRVQEGEAELWLAAPHVDAEVGKIYYHNDGMEMTNFHSKELNRDFAKVYFIESISQYPDMGGKNQPTPGHEGMTAQNTSIQKGNNSVPEKQKVNVRPGLGCITIADLFAGKDVYSGRSLKIKGKVTKFTPEILKRNWIHIQDGTDSQGDFDLTVTSSATVKVGDVITVEGKITLNKDFGFGYFYKVLMEDATVTK